MSRVLVVEDETHLGEGLRFNLKAEGHSVEVAGDGESATEKLLGAKENFDAVVLDVMLSGKDGFAVVSQLRKARNYVPVLILTAHGRPEDVLQGFAAGADDCLLKPFQLPISLARLQGLLRRSEWYRPVHDDLKGAGVEKDAATDRVRSEDFEVFTFSEKTIDFGALELYTKDNTIHLTLIEAKLLRHLIQNKGCIVSRKSTLEDVWGLREDTDTRAIDNFIVRLRRYIEENRSKPRHVLTVRGIGHRFVA
jgi:DNA-binding response OmpR family regulator